MTPEETTESQNAPRAPRIGTVIVSTNAKAALVEERNSYVVTGYVLTHHALAKKAVVDMDAIRWFPNADEYLLMITGRKITPGPGTAPPGWAADELMAAAPVYMPVAATSAPARPVLTASPSARLHETTEDAMGALARELGCVFNDDIPHNAGWFVPGKPTACASAYDAIHGLVVSLKSGGTVYEGKPTVASTDGVILVPETLVRSEEHGAANPAPELQRALF